MVYGVGSNRLHLPVPIGVPDGFSLLLKQCFNFTPKHRPQFRQILLHLDILAADPAFIRCVLHLMMHLFLASKLLVHQYFFLPSHLDRASTPHKTYFACQAEWTAQIAAHFEELKKKNLDIPDADVLR